MTAIAMGAGLYVGYSLIIDDIRKKEHWTTYRESLIGNVIQQFKENQKDKLITKVRDFGIYILPDYKTKEQLLKEEEERKLKAEQERKIQAAIKEERGEMEFVIRNAFYGRKSDKTDNIMKKLGQIGRDLSNLDPTYRSMEQYLLIDKVYKEKFGED